MNIKRDTNYSLILCKTRFCFLLLLISFIMGCASTQQSRPGWIDSPPSGGLSAIGSASYDIFGESWARKRAVELALAELALQKGSSVDVNSQVSNKQVLSNNQFSQHATVTTNAVIKGQEIQISAKIEEYWKDSQGRKVWVLLRED